MWKYILSGLIGVLIAVAIGWSTVFWQPFGLAIQIVQSHPDTNGNHYYPDKAKWGDFYFGTDFWANSKGEKLTIEELLGLGPINRIPIVCEL